MQKVCQKTVHFLDSVNFLDSRVKLNRIIHLERKSEKTVQKIDSDTKSGEKIKICSYI